MLSRLFSDYLKIIKNLQSAKNLIRSIFFSPQNSSVIYNYVFLCYLDCFQII